MHHERHWRAAERSYNWTECPGCGGSARVLPLGEETRCARPWMK